jgi:hypothetical protein
MRIAIELNGVLRDTLGKLTQVYQKNLIDRNEDFYLGQTYDIDLSGNTTSIEDDKSQFEYKIISEVTSLKLMDHFAFKSDDELYDFMYNEHAMEIFGHAGSVEISSMNDFNDFYLDMRDNHELLIVSDEMSKSKPASLFFISKFGCLVENIKFYSETTINSMWDSIDVLLTANPNLLLNYPKNKTVIKYITSYNKDIKSEFEITKLRDFKNLIKEIYD